jgi:hypothetical protein
MALVTSLLIGVIILCVAFYLLVWEIYFVHKATAFNAPIVEVRYEFVPRGFGSVRAYVPVVEIPTGTDRGLRMMVDTFNEEPVYRVGDQMEVLCGRSSSEKCIKNTFVGRWGDSALDFVFSLAFLSFPLFHFFRPQREQGPLSIKT